MLRVFRIVVSLVTPLRPGAVFSAFFCVFCLVCSSAPAAVHPECQGDNLIPEGLLLFGGPRDTHHQVQSQDTFKLPPCLLGITFKAVSIAEFGCISSKSFWASVYWKNDISLRIVFLFHLGRFTWIDLPKVGLRAHPTHVQVHAHVYALSRKTHRIPDGGPEDLCLN